MDTVLWLCPSLPTETLKWLSLLPILMRKSFWWWQCSVRYIISLSPHFHTPSPPPPFSPSLISRTVSVDVKHHVYLLTIYTHAQTYKKKPASVVQRLMMGILQVRSNQSYPLDPQDKGLHLTAATNTLSWHLPRKFLSPWQLTRQLSKAGSCSCPFLV